MALEVVGAGFGRTGTLSLKLALEQLGFTRCYHMLEMTAHPEHAVLWPRAHAGEAVDWDALFEGYKAAVDWPSCNLWREQAAHYPEAKIILTRRDPEKWYASITSTIYAFTQKMLQSDGPEERARGKWASSIIWDHVFDGRLDDESHVIDVYERHNQSVLDNVPADRLLVYEPPFGWEPLCAFFDLPVPDAPYPKVNSTEDFLSRTGDRGRAVRRRAGASR